jgi:hypothetical protein
VKECLASVASASVRSIGEASDASIVRAELESEDADVVERVFAAVVSAGLVLRELRRQEASLEDVFADLTTHDAEEAAEEEDEDEESDEQEDEESDGQEDEESEDEGER